MIRALQVDWQVVLLLAPVALELLRQGVGARWSDITACSRCTARRSDRRG